MDGEALLKELTSPGVIALQDGNPAEGFRPVRDAAEVPELARSTHALLHHTLRFVELSVGCEDDAEL